MTPYRTAACMFAGLSAFLAACQTTGFTQRSVSPDESAIPNLRADMRIMEERINRIAGDVQVLQANYDRLQQQVTGIQQQVAALKNSGGGVSGADIQRLESKIAAVDAARKHDAEVIVNQVSTELAKAGSGGGSRRGSPSAATPPGRISPRASATTAAGTEQGYEHVVEKGQTLSAIAKTYSVTIEAIKKANNLKKDSLVIGQKLFIPKQ